MSSDDSLESTKILVVEEVLKPSKEIDFSGNLNSLLTCPKCSHFIKGADINIEKTIARCSHCTHVFGFAHNSTTGSLQAEEIVPEGIEMLKLKSELELRLDWNKTTSSESRRFFILFTAIWNLFLLPFVTMVILSGTWGILLFLSLHLAVGLGLIWYLASVYLNKTLVSVTQRTIHIRTWPLRRFFSKGRVIDTNDVTQLYVSKYIQSRTNGVPNYAFALYAILKNGEKVSLVRGMTRETQTFIENEVEKYLNIKDRAVPEEAS
jgi:hypothetical protein